jgi:hypothetical protein
MAEKKKFVRQNAAPSVEDLEKTVAQLNNTARTVAVEEKATTREKETVYSYTIKLEEDIERRVEEATKKLRQTKKGFFLSAIEERLEKLGY